MLVARKSLVPVSGLWSIYPDSSGERAPLAEIVGGGFAPAEVLAGAHALSDELWVSYGGRLYISTLGRSWEDQEKAHEENPNNAVEAGYSIHQSCYAIDADTENMGCTPAQFDAAALKTGWGRISNEKWHLQWLSYWLRLYNRGPTGPKECAMAMLLDQGLLGHTYEGRVDYGTDEVAALQAQIWRTYEPGCGAIDGFAGPNTWAALDAMGYKTDVGYQALYSRCSVA